MLTCTTSQASRCSIVTGMRTPHLSQMASMPTFIARAPVRRPSVSCIDRSAKQHYNITRDTELSWCIGWQWRRRDMTWHADTRTEHNTQAILPPSTCDVFTAGLLRPLTAPPKGAPMLQGKSRPTLSRWMKFILLGTYFSSLLSLLCCIVLYWCWAVSCCLCSPQKKHHFCVAVTRYWPFFNAWAILLKPWVLYIQDRGRKLEFWEDI